MACNLLVANKSFHVVKVTVITIAMEACSYYLTRFVIRRAEQNIIPRIKLTFSFGCFVIGFANQFSILHKVKFVTGIELSTANHAGKTL